MKEKNSMGKKYLPKVSFKFSPSFLDMIIVILGIIFVWRGMWNLMDHYFFPGNPLLSNLITLFIGLLLLYLPDKEIKDLI